MIEEEILEHLHCSGEIPQEQNLPHLVKIMQLSIILPVMPVLLWSTLTGSFILRMTMWLLCRMGGNLTIHRIRTQVNENDTRREITTLKMEIQQIMKGNFSTFMQKEIYEQPESVVNTMR